jgi:colanic acid/amylovoran biosynthesis protein
MFGSCVKRVGLMGASFETGNMGVGALAAGAIRCIRTEWPNAEIFIVDYSKSQSLKTLCLDGEQINVPLISIRFSKNLYLANNIAILLALALTLKVLPFARTRKWLISRNHTLRAIDSIDLFTSISGGDSFSDIYGLRRFLYVSLPQIAVICLGKKLILMPQTYGPFRHRVSRLIARFIFNNSAAIYARDHRSADEVNRICPDGTTRPRVSFRYDVGFALEATKPNRIDIEGLDLATQPRLVGLNISGLLHIGGYNGENMFGLRIEYREFILRLLSLLIAEKGLSVLLIPHVFGSDAPPESDVIASDLVFHACRDQYPNRLGIVRGVYDQGEIKYIVGLSDFFIGSRMHACIAGISQCVPTVAVAYSDKFVGVMESIGLEAVVADARKLDLEELLRYIERLYERRLEFRKELESVIPQVVKAALHPFTSVNANESRISVTQAP